MRIAIPVMGFARTGGFRVLSKLANSWIEAGHEVTFLSPCQAESPYFPTTAKIIWLDGWGRETTQGSKTWLPPGGLRGVIGWMWLLARGLSIRATEFDAIIANHSLTSWSVAGAETHARKYYYIQAFEPEYYQQNRGTKGRLLQWLSSRSYRFSLTQIVNAPVYQGYSALRPVGVIPPGIDLSLFRPSTESSDWGTRTVTVGCIGRTEPTKGTRDVFDAFEIAVSRGFRGKLKVAYGGPEHPILNSPLCELVVPKNDRELAEYYRSVDVVVAPGTVQLGAVHYPVLESMACCIPVINTGYAPSDESNSWIVPIHAPESIADALIEMSRQPELRRSRVDRAMQAVQAYAWEKVSADFIRLINSTSKPLRGGNPSINGSNV